MANIELLLEAERRGILPPDKLALLTEAKARGLIGGPPEPQVVQQKPEDVGFFESIPLSLGRGVKGYSKSASGTSLAASSVLGDEEAARKKMADIKTEQKKVEEKPALTVEDIERIYAERGLGAAAGQVPKYIAQQFFQAAPEMAGPLAVGAGAAALSGPFAPIVGPVAGISAYGIQQFGNFLVRQAEEKNDPKELEVAKAALVSAGVAPLGYFTDRFISGFGGMAKKKAGEEILKELSAREIAARTGKRVAGGAAVGIIAEAPVEVLEQAAERYQAGLPLTGDDAYKEYKEAFFGAAAVGGTLGGASRGIKEYREAQLDNAAFRREEQAPGKDTFTEGDEYEDTGVDTGVSKQGVSASGKPEVGTATTAEGVGESDTSGLDAANRPVEELADRENAEQPALTEKQQFLGWLQQNNIVPTSERDIQMYEDMWRKTIAPTETISPSGAPPLDQTPPLNETPPPLDEPPPAAKKVGLTPEEWKIKKKIYEAEKWLRDNKDTQTEENLNQVLDYLTLKRSELATLSASLKPATQAQEQVQPIVFGTKQQGFDFNAPEDPNKTPPVQTVEASTAPAKVEPQQAGFDFVEPNINTQRDIVANEPSKGFELFAPSGQVLKGEGIEIIDGPPLAKLDLATENIGPVESLLKSLKPNTETPRQVADFEGETRTILDTIKEFLGLPLTYKPQVTAKEKEQGITEKPLAVEKGAELDTGTFRRRLGVINTFFNTLSLAPEERQQRLQDLRTALPGLTAEQQGQAFNEFLNIKNLNTVRGVKELRNKLEEWLDSYEGALLGEGKVNAVLGKGTFGAGWRREQYVIKQGDTIAIGPVMKAALAKLKSIHPDQRTPEENAAVIFFSRKSPYEQPFVFALRNAAYVLSSKNRDKDPVYRGETAKNAELFQKWLTENAPDKITEYFDATAADYEKQFTKAEKISEEMRKARAAKKSNISMPWLYRKPSGKPERLKSTAGLSKFMKYGKPEVTRAEDFIEMGAAPEEFGRNRAGAAIENPNLYKADAYYPLHPGLEAAIRNNDLKGGLELMATSKDPYTAGVAKRFLELNLTTTLTMDRQDEITINYLDWAYNRPNSARNKIFDYIRDIVPDLNTDLVQIPVTIKDVRAQYEMLDKLTNYDVMSPVKIELGIVTQAYKDLLSTYDDDRAAYFYHLNTINFNTKWTLTNNDFIHEVAHAASNYALRETNFNKLNSKQQKAVGELKKLFEIAKNDIESMELLDVYGITDIDEFVAEAFANPEFQSLLKSIPYTTVPPKVFALKREGKVANVNAKKPVQVASTEGPTQPVVRSGESMWDRFTRLVAQLLGMDNVLGHTLANANIILQATPPAEYDTNIVKVYPSKGKANIMAVAGTRQTRPESAGFLDNIFGERPSWQAMKVSMPFWLDSLKDATRKYYLSAFTLRQLEDMVGSKLKPMKEFIQNVESMLDARNAILAKTKDVVTIWQKFQSEHPGLAKVLNKLMIDATVETIDPSKFTATNYYGTGSPEAYDKLSKADKEKRKALDAAYKQIGPKGQEVYEEVKKFYADRLAAYKASLLDRIKQTLIADGVAEADVLTHPNYIKINDYFKKHTLEPYFPLKRFGNYWLVINKGPNQTKEFYQFESALERNMFAGARSKEIKTKTGKSPSIDMGNSLRDSKWKGNLQELEFLKDLKELVRTGEGGDVKTLKGNLEESLEQLYLLQLPDQNVRKMFLPRKGTQGMDQDMLRAFTSSAFHMAYQHSRFAFGPKLFGSVKASEDYISGMDPKEATRLRDYTGELTKRVDYIMNPPDTGTIPSFLSNMSFIWYMTAPASALVNMLGVVAVGQPVLGARFGQAETAKTMMAYAKRVGATGFKDDNDNWAFPSIARDAKLTQVQQDAVKRFIADGLFDITLNHDLVGLAEAPSNLYTGRDQRIMQVLSGAFHGAEKFNREVIAMSAFDMAMKKYAKPENGGYKGDKLFDKAIEVTKDLTYKSMFDYSTLNKPRLFQGKWAKVALQFKQFSQQMSYMLVRSGIEGFHNTFNYDNLIKKEQELGGGQLPELEDVRLQINATQRANKEPEYTGPALEAQVKKYYADVRSEGKKRLFGTLGMTFAFAGTTGLPGWWALGKLIEGMQAVFGDEDEADKPFDFNNWYKNWLAENMGNFWGDSISRGLMTQVSGANLADRMGLNDLWFRDARNSPDEVAAVQAFIVSLMGPSVGIGISAVEALKQMREGHLERGIETLSPAILKNLLKAGRFSETFGDGRATTLKGDVLIDDFGVGEIAAQAIGFSPERLSQKQKANIEMKTAEQEILDRRAALLNAYFMGVDNTDVDLMIAALEKIAVFNTSNPGRSIKPDNLKDSVLTRYRQRALAQTTGGMNIDKKLIGQLGGMSAYGNE